MASEQAEKAQIMANQHGYHRTSPIANSRRLADIIDEAADLPRLLRIEASAREYRDALEDDDAERLVAAMTEFKAALSEEAPK